MNSKLHWDEVSAPLVPSPLDYLGRRRFVLYPAITDAGPNEWLRGRSSWSETQLVNAVTGHEMWVPWQYICGVSDSAGLELVVELKEDLEFRNGNVSPRVKRVIPMPAVALLPGVGRQAKRSKKQGPAPVIGIRIQEGDESALTKASRIVLLIAVACVLAGLVFRLLKL